VSKPIIDGFIQAVGHTPSTDNVGVIGFAGMVDTQFSQLTMPSWGYSVDAAYACHPSLVAIPGDFDHVTRPLTLATGTKDSLLGEKEIGQILEILGKKTGCRMRYKFMRIRIMGLRFGGIGIVRRIRQLWMMPRSRELSGLRSIWGRCEFLNRNPSWKHSITSSAVQEKHSQIVTCVIS
jgi:hypothetical protein